MIAKYFNKIYAVFLSKKSKLRFEKIIFLSAIIAYVLHFSLILLSKGSFFSENFSGSGQTQNSLSAIYTPFSIILIYEIYLLIYYLPSSITSYLGRQYEIIALIFIRKIFEELSKLPGKNAFIGFDDLKSISFSFVGLLVLFVLIFCFYKLSGKKESRTDEQSCESKKERRFVFSKKVMAFGLMIFFIFIFFRSFFELRYMQLSVENIIIAIKTTNDVFFNAFFVGLILSEVLLLLFTLKLTDNFSKTIRNSGFIISTILLKLSFMTDGVDNIVIINIAVAFGVAILGIQKLYEKKLK